MSGEGSPDGADPQPAAAPGFKGAPLPPSCPPADATPPGDTLFVRLVSSDSPTANDFRSCALEGKTPPKRHDPCVWQACSFFTEDTPAYVLADIAKGKNHLDKKFKAYVRVNHASGVIKLSTAGNHVSFWMYNSFSPEGAVEKVEPI
jgi:hypothetical protein